MDSYSHETGSFSGKGGIEIFFQKWVAAKAKAVVVVIHGLGSHSGRFEKLIKSLAGKNISVMAMDLRGHGRSEGARGHVEFFMDYIYDLKLFVEYIKSEYQNLPIELYGQGVGAVVSAKYAVTYSGDVSGLVLSSPAFMPSEKPSGFKKGIISFFSPRIPTFSFSSGVNPESLSRDEEVVKAFREDSLVHSKSTARWITEYLKAGSEVLKSPHLVKCPVLVLQGNADSVVDLPSIEKFYNGVNTDKDIYKYDNCFHEIFNEPSDDGEKVLSDITGWIGSVIPGEKGRPASKKSAAKKSAAKKGASKKTVKKVPGKKTSKKTASKKTTVKKTVAKKTIKKTSKKTAKKSVTKKAPSKKTKK